MSDKKNSLPKVYPFVQPDPSPQPRPPTPPPASKKKRKVSERGLLSVVTLLLSTSALTVAMLGGARLMLDIFDEGLVHGLTHFWAKAVVLGLAYFFGWIFAILSIRVYDNLILPIIIKIYTWGAIAAICFLYLMIIQRLYRQSYDSTHYWAYFLIISAGLAALVGLHLALEGHDLRPYAIPLLLICLVQMSFIVIRYVFTADAKSEYLPADLLFLAAMATFSGLMLAHLGLLSPLRRRLTSFFDKNSVVIRPES